MRIKQVFITSGPACDWLRGYLSPGGSVDVQRVLEMHENLYGQIIDYLYSLQSQENCPAYHSYTYMWPGDCSMVCHLTLANGEDAYRISSERCDGLECCGKEVRYCWDPITQSMQKDEMIIWVGISCAAQHAPFYEECPEIDSYFEGQLVIDVDASLCESTCFEPEKEK